VVNVVDHHKLSITCERDDGGITLTDTFF